MGERSYFATLSRSVGYSPFTPPDLSPFFSNPLCAPRGWPRWIPIDGLPWPLASKCVLPKGSSGRSEEGRKKIIKSEWCITLILSLQNPSGLAECLNSSQRALPIQLSLQVLLHGGGNCIPTVTSPGVPHYLLWFSCPCPHFISSFIKLSSNQPSVSHSYTVTLCLLSYSWYRHADALILKATENIHSFQQIFTERQLCQAWGNTAVNNMSTSSPSILRCLIREGFLEEMTMRQNSGQHKNQTWKIFRKKFPSREPNRKNDFHTKEDWP